MRPYAEKGLGISLAAAQIVFCALLVFGSADAAAQQGEKKVICAEIAQRYKVEESRMNGRTLNFLYFDAAERDCLELVQRFLGLGASLAARDRFGNGGLAIAARMGARKVTAYLLAQGAAPDQRNLAGSTALLRAVTMNRRRATKLLLEAGADPNLANKRGVTPLAAAAFNGDDRILALLLEAGAESGSRDVTGKGPLVYAAAKGFTGIIGKLLAAGLDPNARYGNNLTALMWAAGHSNDVPPAEGLETVSLLLSKGAEVGLADNRGRTALMVAAERGHGEIAARLLEAGADTAARDKDGRTAGDLASGEIVKALLSAD